MPSLDYDVRIPQLLSSIEESEMIKNENKEYLKDFYRDLKVMDYSDARIYKLLSHLKKIGEEIDFVFDEASEDNIKDVVIWIKDRDLADTTKRDYRVVLKRFYKWINGENNGYPECVSWIKTTNKKQNGSLPENMLTEEDIKALLKSTNHPRDRAFISMLWETGARIGELMDLEVGSLEDHRHGLKVVINGKTGPRRILLISSVPHINSWINSHPDSENSKAPLWVNIGNTNFGSEMRYRTILKMLKTTMEKAGIDKPSNPHHFRHSRATYLASKFTEAQMNEWFGWVQGSDQPQRYVHLSGRDMDSSYARIHGIEDEETSEESTLAPEECPRCGNSVPPDAKFCYKCGMALSIEASEEIEEQEEMVTEKFTEMVKEDPEVMEDMQQFFKMVKMIRNSDAMMNTFQSILDDKTSKR